MMYWSKCFGLILSCCFLLCACENGQQKGLLSVLVAHNAPKSIEMPSSSLIPLETNDNSLLYDIVNVEILDNKYYIHSRGFVRVFDGNGNYLCDLAKKGQGPNEYLALSNMFLTGDTLCFFDSQRMGVMQFSENGEFLGFSKIQEGKLDSNAPSPTRIAPYKGGWISLNMYGGESSKRPVFSTWNKNLDQYQMVDGRNLSSGFLFPDMFYVDNERVLYWELAKDTLFVMNDHTLTPLYHIDFGEKSLPNEVLQEEDVYNRIAFLGKEKAKQYAGVARYYQRKGDMLYFCYFYPGDEGAEVRLCRYNEMSNKVDNYRFISIDGKYKLEPFFKIHEDKIIFSVKNLEDDIQNPLLYIIPIADLDQ